ncbi:MAG: XdhC family protein [Spirochaetia bacterium]|jgi:xanthine dehydrogenase accessory factor|nr:XdhC family protein [Spirochaetia bacterium]
METIYTEALRLINNKEDFALATVITIDGSAPRGPGAKMIVRKDGSIAGTIGGGVMEAEVMEKAGNTIKNKKAELKELHLNKTELSGIDMICGGDLEVLVDFIDSSDAVNKEIFEYLAAGKKEAAFLVTFIHDTEEEAALRKQCIFMAGGEMIGSAIGSADELRRLAFESDVRYKVVETESRRRYIVESANIHHRAYIFGAGHVGQKTAAILKFVDFHVTVMDDRPQFANRERFPETDDVIVTPFEESFDNISIDRYSYIIIVTRGHVNDQLVLALALKTNAGYIGMIGSKRKRRGVFQNLVENGFSQADFDRVYNPIGLSIDADSPEEIAVSIAAEIIKVRAELSK